MAMRLGHGFLLQVFATEAFSGEIRALCPRSRTWRWVRPRRLGGLPTTPELGDVLERAFALFDRG